MKRIEFTKHWYSCYRNSFKSVIFLLVLMAVIGGFGRLTRLLELKSAEAQELVQKTQHIEQQLEMIKQENTELKIPNKERVFKEVDRLFGSHAVEAKKVISCENASTAPERINLNKDNTADFGPFQINLIHAKRFGTKFMVDSVENVRVAYQIFQEQKWRPWYSSNSCHRLAYK